MFEVETYPREQRCDVELVAPAFFEVVGPRGGGALEGFGHHLERDLGRPRLAHTAGRIRGRAVEPLFAGVRVDSGDTLLLQCRDAGERRVVAAAVAWWVGPAGRGRAVDDPRVRRPAVCVDDAAPLAALSRRLAPGGGGPAGGGGAVDGAGGAATGSGGGTAPGGGEAGGGDAAGDGDGDGSGTVGPGAPDYRSVLAAPHPSEGGDGRDPPGAASAPGGGGAGGDGSGADSPGGGDRPD